jgi:hypothetical protein
MAGWESKKFGGIMNKPPNPGSDEALDAGCICAVLDNAHGRGAFDFPPDEDGNPMFWITGGCPLHAPQEEPNDRV